MSPYLHYEIARSRHHEIEARVMRPHHAHVPTSPGHARRSLKVRIGRAVAAVGGVRRSLAAS
jgi:hypothetical protein